MSLRGYELVFFNLVPIPRCPLCSEPIELAVLMDLKDRDAGAPVQGTITPCLTCGKPLVFNSTLQLRAAMDGDWTRYNEAFKEGMNSLGEAIRRGMASFRN